MKKYYCINCKEFKNRFQVKWEDDTLMSFLVCKWCHKSSVYRTEDMIRKAIEKTLTE